MSGDRAVRGIGKPLFSQRHLRPVRSRSRVTCGKEPAHQDVLDFRARHRRCLRAGDHPRPATRHSNDESLVRRVFMLCFSRAPADAEARIAASFFARGKTLARDDERQRRRLLAAYCQALLSTAEFRNLD